MKTEQYGFLGLSLVCIGGGLLLVYLSYVEAGMHFYNCVIAITLIALGLVLSNEAVREGQNISFLLVAVAVSMYLLSIMPSARFNVFSGTMVPDNLYEFTIAKATLAQGVWGDHRILPKISWEDGPIQYFSCLSVTIFPAILSEITGISLFGLFRYVYPLIFCIIPLMAFFLTKYFLNNIKLAALSPILFVEYYQFSTPGHAREFMALLFLLLTMFSIIKQETVHRTGTYIFLAMLFEIGVVVSHYTVAYFINFMFVFILLFTWLLSASTRRRLRRIFKLEETKAPRHFNKNMTTYLLVVSTTWLFFVNREYTLGNLSLLKDTVLTILGKSEAGWTPAIVAPGRISGPIVSGWYVFCFLLIVTGFLVFTFYRKKNRLRIALISGALSMFIILSFSTFTPTFSRTLTATRVITIALPLWVLFFAYTVGSIERRFRRSGHILMVTFLLVNLPMSMSLISHSNFVLYSPEKAVPAELAVTQTYIREDENSFSEWAQNYLPINERVSVDIRGMICLYSALNVIAVAKSGPEDWSSRERFLFLHSYTLRYNLWLRYDKIELVTVNDGLIAKATVVYNTGNTMLLMNSTEASR